MGVELRQMRHLVAVAEERHMAQQSLSASIARLEAQLGVCLLERSPGGADRAGAAFPWRPPESPAGH